MNRSAGVRSEIPLERVRCPYCGGEETEMWAEESGYQAVRCTACRLVYVNPRPPLDSISQAVRIGYHDTPGGRLQLVGLQGFRRAKARMFEARLRELLPGDSLEGRRVRWLDIGCGFGELLAAVARMAAPGSLVEGIEPSESKSKTARRRGLRVTKRTLDEVDQMYDHVSLINVFSHLPQPARLLEELRRILEPGGNLIFVTGNGADVSREEYPDPLFLPDHLVFAGESHIRGFLERAGFRIVRVRAYREFLPESAFLIVAKNVVRRLLGRPMMPFRNPGPYRSLFFLARLGLKSP